MAQKRRFFFSFQELILGAATFLWGGTFYLLHVAMQSSGPFFFVGMSFLIAALSVTLVTGWKNLRQMTALEIKRGCAIGVGLSCGLTLQTVGLKTIPSSRSAFLVALYVPLVPLLEWGFLRKSPHIMSWIAIALAFVGLVCLSGPIQGGLSLSYGDILTLAAALAIAVKIFLITRLAPNTDSRRITIVQLLFGSFASFAVMPFLGESVPAFAWQWVICALLMGVIIAIVHLVMNWTQRTISPTRAAVIYSTEPVWAGLMGYFVGDTFTAMTLVGAAFISGAVLCNDLRPQWIDALTFGKKSD